MLSVKQIEVGVSISCYFFLNLMDSFDLATDRVASIARGHQVDRTSLSLSLSRVFIEKKKKGRIRNRRASLWRLIFVG